MAFHLFINFYPTMNPHNYKNDLLTKKEKIQ